MKIRPGPLKNHRDSQKYFDLWVMLARTRDGILRIRNNELKPYDITAQQAGILSRIKNCQNNMIPAELARMSLRKPNTTTVILGRMEKKGLIKKGKDLTKKNLIRLSLTKKGESINNYSSKRESINRLMATLSEDQITQLQSILEVLLDNIRKELKQR
jgi:DNA-binding MarR family transcriptional regulator